MDRLAFAFVLGYHGCDESVAEKLILGEPFKESKNDYDWLGPGIYFWEANPLRGLEFAHELKNSNWGPEVENPTVVGAVIDLGLCVDLTTSVGIQQIRNAHKAYILTCEQAGYDPPKNSSEFSPLIRKLDCAVFKQLHEIRKDKGNPPIDTIRGVFTEGDQVFEDSGFLEKTHIQICVRNRLNIKGVFRVPKNQLS